jgi:hypothetical protein
MRIVHLRETLLNPVRFVLAVWDAGVGSYAEGVEWIVHATGDKQLIVDRFKMGIKYFQSQQCVGVTSEVNRILVSCGISLPEKWKSYDTKR